jgi:ubiquinone/menaquinone biosynthesis C-methylase UbiE
MTDDPFRDFKNQQRLRWASFAPFAMFTAAPAAHLVRFAGIRSGQAVLDVATGTGVVAITARLGGARVTALDLTPELLAQAKENAAIAGIEDIAWHEGDVEALPFPDGAFDVVVSQFGHIFAPRPEVALREMLRVLKPGGRIAFATWPPEQMVGRLFTLTSAYAPPPPDIAPPPLWGDPNVVRERLGRAVSDLFFERGVMRFTALSPAHYRVFLETTSGSYGKLVQDLESDPPKLARLRRELEALAAEYHVDNAVREEYLLSRATKI